MSNQTLLFCTSHITSDENWERRCRRWFDHLKDRTLEFDQLLVVDNGSPELPGWSDTRVIYDLTRKLFSHKNIIIFRFEDTVSTDEHSVRSFQVATDYTNHYGFQKLIHIESDVYVLSKRLAQHINNLDSNIVKFPTDQLTDQFIGDNYSDRGILPDEIDYACGVDETWDDIFVKHLDIQRNYTYNR